MPEHYVKILTKGRKYIPKPEKIHKNDIYQTFKNYSRRVKLQYFFFNKTKNNKPRKFQIPSMWRPPEDEIDPFITQELEDLQTKLNDIKLSNKANKNSYTKNEIKYLKKLKENKSIIIKPVDKGSSIIIQNRQDYLKEAHRQLSNPLHYKKIEQPISLNDHEEINELLLKLKNLKYITKKEFTFLQPNPDGRPRKIYFTPKIHKNPSSWPLPNIPPARPIVSDVGSDTYNLSQLIDYYLAPFSNRHDSYIKDTPDFLDKIRMKKIPKDSYLISLDVESLYTNINIQDGIKAIRATVAKYPQFDRPDDILIKLLEISLKNNDFQLAEFWFLQIYGTSMGKIFSPHYADIFMAWFEQGALAKCNQKPYVYFRFLDDIFVVWTHTLEQFQTFLDTFNTHHPTIKFKATIDPHSITFLDMEIFKGPQFQQSQVLDTRVYFKPTDTHELLHKNSYHPPHTFRGIIKSQIIRFDRICSNNIDFKNAVKILFSVLHKRGYKPSFTKQIYDITTAEIAKNNNQFPVIIPCETPQCRLHRYLEPLTKLNYHGKSFPITDNMSCNSKNLIYSIKCNLCQFRYIGHTKNTLRERFYAHKSTIKHHINKVLANHVNKCIKIFKYQNPEIVPITITPLTLVTPHADKEINTINLLNKETELITELNTIEPNGINNPKDAENPIPITLKYSDQSNQIATLFKETHLNLQKEHKKIFKRQPIVAHIKNRNIHQYLIRTELEPQ